MGSVFDWVRGHLSSAVIFAVWAAVCPMIQPHVSFPLPSAAEVAALFGAFLASHGLKDGIAVLWKFISEYMNGSGVLK